MIGTGLDLCTIVKYSPLWFGYVFPNPEKVKNHPGLIGPQLATKMKRLSLQIGFKHLC